MSGKTCGGCKTEKPFSEFYPNRKRGGYMHYCKVCSRKRAKLWAVRNAVHVRRHKGEYKKRRRKDYTQWQREYIARLKANGKYDEFLARKREWYRRRRQYLPSPDIVRATRTREQEGYITPRRRNKLSKIVDKVVSAL